MPRQAHSYRGTSTETRSDIAAEAESGSDSASALLPRSPAVPTHLSPEENFREMIWVPGGTFRMGSDHHYPEEAPAHRVSVDGFWIDPTPVTNRQFARFVEETGHITFAEMPPNVADYPNARPEMSRPGSLVFVRPKQPVPLENIWNWWSYCFGADWRHPRGPDSTIEGREDHPVVHIAYSDAKAYAAWIGKDLPTEAEWEFAARGGRDGEEYAWGDEFHPGGISMANTWHGEFPWQNLAQGGFQGTSPVGRYPANGYGLYDMIGNVWEWTSDWYHPRHPDEKQKGCCIPHNPRGGERNQSFDPCHSQLRIPRKVLKGGSQLCAPNYCRRYRPAARYPQPVDTSTSHVGFRCVRRSS